MKIEQLNALDCPEFVRELGWVFEGSPWIAERACERRPFASIFDLHQAMTDVVEHAPKKEQEALLRAHPDLGGRMKMSDVSRGEQEAAGLDRLSPDAYVTLRELNDSYREKFGFPFIYAVKGNTWQDILVALGTRMENSQEEEFRNALAEVSRIAKFRLEEALK